MRRSSIESEAELKSLLYRLDKFWLEKAIELANEMIKGVREKGLFIEHIRSVSGMRPVSEQ